jgi:hypothetical protein
LLGLPASSSLWRVASIVRCGVKRLASVDHWHQDPPAKRLGQLNLFQGQGPAAIFDQPGFDFIGRSGGSDAHDDQHNRQKDHERSGNYKR